MKRIKIKKWANSKEMFEFLAIARSTSSPDELEAFDAAIVVASGLLRGVGAVHPDSVDRTAMFLVAACMTAGAQKMIEDAKERVEAN